MKIKPIRAEWLVFKLYFFLVGILMMSIGITQFFNCVPLFIFKAYSVLMVILGVIFIYTGVK